MNPKRSLPPSARAAIPITAVALVLLSLGACGESDAPPAEPGRPPGFEEVAEQAGIHFRMTFLESEQGKNFKINLYDHGSGVCVADYDGDGRDDFYILNQLGRNALYRNRGDGTFEETTDAAGVGLGDRVCTSAAFGDYDNDGDQDLYVSSVRGGNTLFRNEGGGQFRNVTEEAGVGCVAHTQGVTFLDYDSDGFLDIYVTNTALWTMDLKDPKGRYYFGATDLFSLVQSPPEKNVLYRNLGDGRFKDVTEEVGVGGESWGGDIAHFDYDDDGDLDLFVTNMFGASILYRNDGEGKRFSVATAPALGRTPWGAVACKVLDFDCDGRLDLLVIDMHSDMWMNIGLDPSRIEQEKKYDSPIGPAVEWGEVPASDKGEYLFMLRLEESVLSDYLFGSALYHNLGGGKFEEVSARAGIESLWPWGTAVIDYDLDGYEDIFIPSGMGFPYFPWPNALFMNARNGSFVRREKAEGMDPRPGGPWLDLQIANQRAARSSRSASVFDYNDDGRPDLIVNNFNDRANLYRNQFPPKPFVSLRLRGTTSNRDAVGAVVRLTTGGRVLAREVSPAGGYLAQDSHNIIFGLGDAGSIDACEVTWPTGRRQKVSGLKVGRVNEVVEE